MPYVPPFDRLRQLVQISTINGELRISATYDDFLLLLRHLLSAIEVDDAWYLQAYPDVAEAVRTGGFTSAKHHFVENGYMEGRFPALPAVDESWYLQRYPDVAESVQRGDFASAARHFIEEGYREGRLPRAT